MIRSIAGVVLGMSAFIFLLITSVGIDAQAPPRTVQDGVYSEAQASRGQALYAQRCAGCHGPKLEGAQAPALTGEAFIAKFRMEPLSALFIQIRYAMPPTIAPGTPPTTPPTTPPAAAAATQLTNEQGADLVAHILKSNGFPAGKADFAASDAMNSKIAWPAAAAATAGRAAPSSPYRATGTINQLMRGIFFHNSNLIFSIQEVEPSALPPPPPPSRPDGLTMFDWGLLVYTGWSAVENSATAIADASTLLLQPGLRCENGRAAPITEPDWIRLTDEMIAVAKRTYRLAQTKDKDAVSSYTLELSNACNACHRTYRDVGGRGRGIAGLANTAGRCTHR